MSAQPDPKRIAITRFFGLIFTGLLVCMAASGGGYLATQWLPLGYATAATFGAAALAAVLFLMSA